MFISPHIGFSDFKNGNRPADSDKRVSVRGVRPRGEGEGRLAVDGLEGADGVAGEQEARDHVEHDPGLRHSPLSDFKLTRTRLCAAPASLRHLAC